MNALATAAVNEPVSTRNGAVLEEQSGHFILFDVLLIEDYPLNGRAPFLIIGGD